MLSLFVGNSSNIKSSVFTIEELGNLFERGVACFDEEEIDDPDLKCEEDTIADIVLPLECIESDGVDVLIWQDCQLDSAANQRL